MRFLTLIISIVLISFLFASCDKVDCPTCDKDIVKHNDDTIFRKVLLEEYTGFRCPNCPPAAVEAHDLKDYYGENLVVIAVHAGILAMPVGGNYAYDFRTPAGTAWDNFFGPSSIGLPKGMVNRRGYPVQSTYILDALDWGDEITSVINDSADANIEIIIDFDEVSRDLAVSVDAYFYNALIGTYYINICLIEDSIITYQKDQVLGDISDYVHMHALRKSISNIWGDSIATDPVLDSIAFHHRHFPDYTIDNKFNIENCSIVAFIYRQDNAGGGKYGQYEIVQAEEKKLKK